MKRFHESWSDFESNNKFLCTTWCCENHEV